MSSDHLLVVDDHEDIRTPLAVFLLRQGFAVSVAVDVPSARAVLCEAGAPVSLVLLDVMLPGESGLALCRELHLQAGPPVILLTARNAREERIGGLELGADDYVNKPFDPHELVARVRTVLRRTRPSAAGSAESLNVPATGAVVPPQRFRFDGWELDLDRRELRDPAGAPVPLSAAEVRLLTVLVRHPGQVLSRERLLDLTSEDGQSVFDRSIDSQVSRLRRKLEADPRRPALIKTAWGDGYLLTADVSSA